MDKKINSSMKNLISLLIIGFFFSSCSPSTSTIEPLPTASSTLAMTQATIPIPTLTPTPSITPTPLPLEFVYQDNVSADARTLQEQAANKAYIYYSQYATPGPITIYTFADINLILDKIASSLQADYGQTKSEARDFWPTTGGFSAGNDIVINSGFLSWADQGHNCNKAKVVAHEMFHLVQRSLLHHALNRFIDYGPEWLKEGSAEMMGNRVVDGLGNCNYKQTLNSWLENSRDADFSLQQVEGRDFTEKIKFWSVAPWAVDYLISFTPQGEKSLIEYYSEIGNGKAWRDAFKSAFGMSIEDFYTAFETYRDKSKITMDTSVCTTQSDGRIKCLGREPNSNNGFDYVFKLPFVVKTQPQQWKWESACNITSYGAQGTGNVNELSLSVDNYTQGDCHVKFTFSTDQQVTVDFVVPVDSSVTPVSSVAVKGKVILDNTNQKPSDYVVSFCNLKIEQCLSGVLIADDGTFFTHLIPGDYRFNINPLNGGEGLGWYTKNGLVSDPNCAEIFHVGDQELNLIVDFHQVACPTIPTPEGGVPIHGNIILGDPSQTYADIILTFCQGHIEPCEGSSTSVNPDGSFSISLKPSVYRVGVSSKKTGQFLGWYAQDGIVPYANCGERYFAAKTGQETTLTLDLHPAPCR